MGNTKSASAEESEKMAKCFEDALRKAAEIARIPVCSDFMEYIQSLRPILDKIIGDHTKKESLIVDRHHVYQTAMSHYKTKFHNEHERIHEQPIIIFKTGGVEEEAYGSGVRREFYSQFFQKCLLDRSMFVGEGRSRVPSHDMSKAEDCQFEALGVAIVEAILNGDCGFPYLNEALYHYIIDDKDYDQYFNVDDIPDAEVKALVEKIVEANSDEVLQEIACSELGAPLEQLGWQKTFILKHKEELVKRLIEWDIILRPHFMIQRFKAGLNYMGFLDQVKNNNLLKSLFVYSKAYSVSVEYLQKCMDESLKKLKAGKDSEQKAKEYLEKFLKDIDDDQASDLFVFTTGSLDPPIQVEKFEVAFCFKEDTTLPEAKTCINRLELPLANGDYETFKQNMLLTAANGRAGFK